MRSTSMSITWSGVQAPAGFSLRPREVMPVKVEPVINRWAEMVLPSSLRRLCASVHLLIPGSTFTGMTARGRTEKPAGAWTPDQVIDMLVDGMGKGDFYILCPDNEVTRAVDERRIAWAAGDIVENRPALSRWHPDYKAAFERFLAE